MENAPLVSVRGERARVPLLIRIAFRYFITGQPLRGVSDNSTFFYDATVDYRGRPYIKLTRARWRRVTRRNAAVWTPACAIALYATVGAWAALLLLGSAVLSLAAYGALRLARWWPDRLLQREYVQPAARVLAQLTNTRYRRRQASTLIELPAGFGQGVEDGGEPLAVRVHMPGAIALPDTLKKRLEHSLSETLGIPGGVGQWSTAGARPYVDLFAAPVPPKTVTMRDVRAAMLAAPLHNPVAGLAAGRKVVALDFEQDSPHVSFSGPSGTGKSVYAKMLLAQRLRNGAGAIVLDYKRWSHRWLHDMPDNVCRYLWRIEDIHDALVAVGEELHRRISAPEEEQDWFRTTDIIVEEINSLSRSLTRYWKAERKRIQQAAKAMEEMEIGSAEPGDLDPPLQSPAVVALQEGVSMGRELHMHWWVIAQRLSSSVFGGNGGDIRESFQLRNIAKWNRKLWAMLVDGLKYVACPSGPRGIWGVQLGEEFHIFRVPFLSDNEARSFALSGAPPSGPILGSSSGAIIDGAAAEGVNGAEHAALPEWSTLRDSLRYLPAGADGGRLELEGLRSAAKRSGFPASRGAEGGASLYSLRELMEWRRGALLAAGQLPLDATPGSAAAVR